MELRRTVRVRVFRALATTAAILTALFGVFAPLPATAIQSVPYLINFQGRLTDNSGNVLTDGSYNVKFRIWDAASGGTNRWEADRLYGASDHRITVQNGLFNIQFGDATAGDPALSPSLFNTQTYSSLYLEVELPTPATATCATSNCASWTEGAMTPRQPLASATYAFNSDTLDGLDSSAFVQLSVSQQSGAINVSGNITSGGQLQAGTVDAASSGALTLGGTNATGITLAKNTTLSSGLSLTLQGANALTLGSTSNSGGILFQDGTANNFKVTLAAPALAESYALNLPTDGASGALCLQSTSGSTSTNTSLQFGACSGTVPTLQNTYASSSPASITLTDAKDFTIIAADTTTDPNVLVNLQCVTSCGSNGRFAVQSAGTDVLAVSPAGQVTVAPASGKNLTVNLSASGSVSISSATAPTTSQVSVDNTASTGVVTDDTTAVSSGLHVNFKGGAAAVQSEGIRIDYAPGGTSGGTWSGLRIVGGSSAASGVTSYGLKIDGLGSTGTGTDEALYAGANWDIGIDLQSGGIQLAAQTDPTTPAAGNLRFYAKTVAGRTLPKWKGPSGVDTPVQANFGFNRIAMMAPSGNGTSATTIMTNWGTSFSNSCNTCSNPTLATTSLSSSVRRARIQTATNSSTAIAYHAPSALMAWRGNGAGLGGFFFTTRFNLATLNTSNRAFVGLVDSTTAPASVDPTTSTTPGKLGLAINTNTGNWNWVNNLTGTAPTVTGLGASYPVNTTDLYELIIYSPPNGSSITYRVQDISTGAVTADTTVSTNIPSNTTFLAPEYWIADGGTTGATAIDCAGWYLESDN